MLFLFLAAIAFCATEIASIILLALYVPADVASAWALSTTLLGLMVLVYVWYRYCRHTMVFRDGEFHLKTGANELLLVLSGILLTIPGVFSDLVGLALLVPAVRRSAIVVMEKYWQAMLRSRHDHRNHDN